MADSRQRKTERRRGKRATIDPDIKRRWNQAYQLSRYGLTPERFAETLKAQGYACGMCRESFAEESPIAVDHDHACCPGEKRSCGKCVRGLLCRSCNTALGHIERKGELARAYLASPPALAA